MGDSLNRKLGKLRTEAMSEKERKKLLSIFHEGEHEFDLKKELYQQLESLPDEAWEKGKDEQGFERFWKKVQTPGTSVTRNKKIPLNYWFAAAAILVVGLLIGNLIQQKGFETVSAPVYYTSKAPKGSIAEMILPDGTVIFLNSGSEIKYASDMQAKSREVYLTGEAWFDVQKLKDVPFLVHTDHYDVRVLGTEFNVKAYSEDSEVVTTLEKGSIQIQSTKNLKLKQDVQLVPGEQLVYHKANKTIQVAQVKPGLFSSWKDNKLIFINMNLGELITLLERKYGVNITVRDQQLLNHHYDGTIKNETIIEVLEILQATLPITYSINEQEIIITKR